MALGRRDTWFSVWFMPTAFLRTQHGSFLLRGYLGL